MIHIGGKKHLLSRAVDQDGFVLDVLVRIRRDTMAADRLLCIFMNMEALSRPES
jgi:putative transposase